MNDNLDYRVQAELFPAPRHRHGQLAYHRFDSLAEALRYAMEELTPPQLTGAFIEADEVRYSATEIATLYNASGYPLTRKSN